MVTVIKIILATFMLLGVYIGLLGGGPLGLSITAALLKIAAGG